eukprot:m.262074 g.262074  ORF g.262074 m.262074 type:complete len:421 (-) comp44279_c0_seq1:117-1379(-)
MAETTKHVVPKSAELRIEVLQNKQVVIKVVEGTAEIFGAELVAQKKYTLSEGNVAVFSWHGCTVEITGTPESTYVSEDNPMLSYVNAHAALEQSREVAKATGKFGPRVLIAGPPDVGKSTLSKILANYATRAGRRPLFVDLDAGESCAGLPGTLSMTAIDRPGDIWTGFEQFEPLCFHYGKPQASDNARLYRKLVARMAIVAEERSNKDENIKCAGYIINTNFLPKDLLMDVQIAFKADVIVVIDNERLYNELKQKLSDVALVKLSKSGGVVARDEDAKSRARVNQVKRYFYGPPAEDKLYCYSLNLPFNEIRIHKIGAPPVPTACLPIGADPTNNETELVAMKLATDLHQTCFAVSPVPPNWKELKIDILECEAMGFVSIQGINLEHRTITLLSPDRYPLPRTPCTLLLSSQRFSDAAM